jgi:hypothetical protein
MSVGQQLGVTGSRERQDTRVSLPGQTPEEQSLAGLSVEEKQMQLENLKRQQAFQALLQQTATTPGGIFDEAAQASYQAGAGDIDNATRESLRLMREELAPSLGLRSTDSPIIDRGGLVARQGILAKGSLQNSLRAQALTNRLALLQGAGNLGLGLSGIGDASGSSTLNALTQARMAARDTSSVTRTLGLSSNTQGGLGGSFGSQPA